MQGFAAQKVVRRSIWYVLSLTFIVYLVYLMHKLFYKNLQITPDPSLKFEEFGFSGSGLLTIYHTTVVNTLISSLGSLPREYKVAGASGGSWVAAAICSGQNVTDVTTIFEEFINKPEIPNIHDDIEPILRDVCNKIIPLGDGWKNCNGKLEVTVTQVKKNCAVDKPLVIDTFTSRQDLVDAMVASSFLSAPIISPKCYITLNGTKVKDGYFSDAMPCPRNSQNCIGISAIPKQLWGIPFFGSGDWKHAKIYPGMTGKLPMPLFMYFGAFLDNKITRRYTQEIINGAIADAEYYIKTQNLQTLHNARISLRV